LEFPAARSVGPGYQAACRDGTERPDRRRLVAEVLMSWVTIRLLCASASFATAGDLKVGAPRVVPPPPPAEFALAPQPVYGPLRRIVPAHQLALLEYREQMNELDPRVAGFAHLLGQLTARYVEDAANIVQPTVLVCQELRSRQKEASPVAILKGALVWTRPAG